MIKYLKVLKKIKISEKKLFLVSNGLLLVAVGFLVYSVIYSPYTEKLPKFGHYFKGVHMMQAAKKLPVGSSERQRLEAIADATKKGQSSFTSSASPQILNNLQGGQ